MSKKVLYTPLAPAPIGPYSQAVWAGDMLFISGQIAIDPATGNLEIGDIETETRRVLQNLEAILTAAGLTFSNVVKTNIFLSDMNLFGDVNAMYGACFESDFPARETVAVRTLPKNVNVEISMIAMG